MFGAAHGGILGDVDETRSETTPQGRTLRAELFGKNETSLEAAALDAARQFFGPGPRLEVVRDYRVMTYPAYPPDRRYQATVTVREIVPPPL